MTSVRSRAWVLLALLGAFGLALTGCGRTPLSTRALRSRATRICGLATAKQNRLSTPRATGQGAAFLTRGAATLRTELRALRALDAGGRAAPVYRRALTALEAERQALSAGATALAHGGDPVSEIRSLQSQLAPPEAQADAAWRSLEIPACLTR